MYFIFISSEWIVYKINTLINSKFYSSIILDLFQRKEREMQQKLDQKEETALELQETYASLQQEVEVKTKKLKKVRNHLGGLLLFLF